MRQHAYHIEEEETTMALVPWTPIRHFAALQGQMNQLLDQFFRGGNGEEAPWGVSAWMPPVDLYETPDEFILSSDLPGLTKDDIHLEVHDRTLTLRGERKPAAGMTEAHYQRRERAYGSFLRAFTLPTPVDTDKVQASMKDGILELHLPKHEAAKPRRIAVQS
jgi:HSP20 family protein